jgi:hypothetical protein
MSKNDAQTELFEDRPTTRLLGLHKRTEPEAKHEGMEAAESNAPEHGYDMNEMRRYARHYIRSNQSMRDIPIHVQQKLRQSNNVAWIDPVRNHEYSFGKIPELAGTDNNCLGSLFSKKHPEPDKCFVWTGEYIESKIEGAHYRRVMLWTLPQYLRKP